MHHQQHGQHEQAADWDSQVQAHHHIHEQQEHHNAHHAIGDRDFAEGQADAPQPLPLQVDQGHVLQSDLRFQQFQEVEADLLSAAAQQAQINKQGAD